MDEDQMALLIPMVLFVCLLGAVAVTMYFRTRREHERHETLRKMVEKGMEIPPTLLEPPAGGAPASDLRRGLVLVGLGVGLMVLLLTLGEPDARRAWAVGLIPTLMGGAYLVTWRVRLRGKADAEPERVAT